MKFSDSPLGILKNENENCASNIERTPAKSKTLLDPMCHYNTSLRSNFHLLFQCKKIKCMF